MKLYKVYYIIKRDRHGYLEHLVVLADNQKAAIQKARETVRKRSGRTAFNATCKEPVAGNQGLTFNGMTYTRHDPNNDRLW